MEDVEKMVRDAIPGGEVEFIPAGMSYAMKLPRTFFRDNPRSEVLLLAGAHANCESMTLLISDGKAYRGINHYLKNPLSQVAAGVVARAQKIEPALRQLDPHKPLQRLRGQLMIFTGLGFWLLGQMHLGRIIGNPFSFIARLFGHGSHLPEGAKKARRPRRVLRVGMLPFEEEHSIDAARLENCRGVFAYEDVEDGKVKYISACLWYPYRNAFLEKLSKKYGIARKNKSAQEAEAIGQAADPQAVSTSK